MLETYSQQQGLIYLENIQEREAFSTSLKRFSYEPELHERYKQRSYQQWDAQNECDRPREAEQEIVEHTCHDKQEREKGDTDGECCREDGTEKVCATLYGSMPARHSFSYLFQVIIDDYDGVVDNHS